MHPIKKQPLFFLRSFNDIDHITPVIWKFQQNGEKPVIVFTSNYSYDNDYRIRFLISQGYLEIYRHVPGFLTKLQNKIGKRITKSGIVYKTLLLNINKQIRFLEEKNIYTCIFEWGEPKSRGPVVEKFFYAAKSVGLPTFSIPHGCNIYLNTLVNKRDRELNAKGIKQDMTARNEFDCYVVQSPYHREQSLKMGLNPQKCHVWGSTRFYPEWQKINLGLCNHFTPEKDDSGRVKVIFMLPHWDYNVDKKMCLELIEQLIKIDNIFLIIKDHTRGQTGGLNDEERKNFETYPNVETNVSAHSPALIAWSDAVINFGSSIGIEALLQDKTLINPFYLHTNKTIFEKTGAAFNASDNEEVLSVLSMIRNGKNAKVPETDKNQLFKEIIYGGRERFDVLDYYYQCLSLKIAPSAY